MKSYSVTDVGQKRQVNQDYIFASEEPVGNLPNLFVVADGMGGHKAGDFASSYAVQILLHSILEDENQNPIIIIRHAIEEANRKVLEEANLHEEMSGMGTTMVLVTIVDDYAYVANVGDSRLVSDRGQDRPDHKGPFPGRRDGPQGIDHKERMRNTIRIKILLPESSASDRKLRWTSLISI